MLSKEIKSNIKKFKKYIKAQKEVGEFHVEGLGNYSYADEIINLMSSITDCEEYQDIYIPNLKKTFQNGNIERLSFNECVTYFHWLWTAERMAPGTIKKQIEYGRFEKVLEQLENPIDKKSIREELQMKYYTNWKPLRSAWKEYTKTGLIKMYEEYIEKLEEFIEECDEIIETHPELKKDFKPNYRQTGGYQRCMAKNVDGWDSKHEQFAQRYKELMVDYLHYSEDLEYDEMSIKEIETLKEMASHIISVAEDDIYDIERRDNPNSYLNKSRLRGYLTRKPEKRDTESGVAVATFTLAVMRNFKNGNDGYDFDFVNCVCWRSLADKVVEFNANDFVAIEGRIQTRAYTDQKGERRYVTEIVCIEVDKED